MPLLVHTPHSPVTTFQKSSARRAAAWARAINKGGCVDTTRRVRTTLGT